MSFKTVEIVEKLKSLTLIETAELVKQIEDNFNVNASLPQVKFPFIINPIQDEKQIESQQTEFDVILEEVPSNQKIAILKLVRVFIDLPLKEAKNFVESVPQTLKAGIAIAEAESMKKKLEAVGATVSLK